MTKDEKRFRRELKKHQEALNWRGEPTLQARDQVAIEAWCDTEEEKARNDQEDVLKAWQKHYVAWHGAYPPADAKPSESFSCESTFAAAGLCFLSSEFVLGSLTAMTVFRAPAPWAVAIGVGFTALSYAASRAVLHLQQDLERPRESARVAKQIAIRAFTVWLAGIGGYLLITRASGVLDQWVDTALKLDLTILTLATPVLAAAIHAAGSALAWANGHARDYRTYADRLREIKGLRRHLELARTRAWSYFLIQGER
jgi:hypothetical protein